MSIRVTCSKCLTRFNVSEKFAGQKGPCPKCKAVIEIPKAEEEVVVHAPDTFGPKGTDGRGVLEPVFREDKPVSPITLVLSVAIIVILLLVSVFGRFQYPESASFPLVALAIGALLASFPVCFVSYQLLYNREQAGFTGGELYGRVAAAAAGVWAMWILSPILAYTFQESVSSPGTISQAIAVLGLILAGAAVAMLALDFDYPLSLVVSGIYLVVCILMRLLAGLTAIPGMKAAPKEKEEIIKTLWHSVDYLCQTCSWMMDGFPGC